MDVKKALSYIAFGFFFTLVNINMIINGTSINITPDFVGWILMFLSFDKLGSYVEGKVYLKWISLILAVVTGAIWILSLALPNQDLSIVSSLIGLVSLVYTFNLFGVLEKICQDYGSSYGKTISTLKILNIVLYVLFVVFALLATKNLETFGMLSLVFGVGALVCAIITCVVLFKLRKEINNRED